MLNQEEQNYLNLLKALIDKKTIKADRTATGTKSIFGTRLRFSLEDFKIPALTTKRVFIRGAIEELLFFIRGETDTKKLEAKGVNIWKGNTSREFLDKRGLRHYNEGEMGPMYGFQWRNFGAGYRDYSLGIDQLQNCFGLIKNDPTSRRMLLTAYNPNVAEESVLFPCHTGCQFYVDEGKLSCMFQLRSSDIFLGAPFNFLTYSILTHLMAKATGLLPGELIYVGGDTHLYLNHEEQAKEQISREPYEFPTLNIKKDISSIKDMENLCYEDFKIIGYKHNPAIKAEMAI